MNQGQISRRDVLITMASTIALGNAHANEQYPNRTVKIIVPFPPGGSGDALARAVGQKMSALWKQPVIIENKPGAGTAIGADAVAKSKPDGYTLGLVNSAFTTNPSLRSNLPFNTLKDLVGIAPLAGVRIMVLVNPTAPVKNIGELIELSKKTHLNYGTPGTGTSPHLTGELLNMKTGSKLNHIGYKGSAPALVELLGGGIECVIDAFSSINIQYIKAGKVKLIAVTGNSRSKEFPDTPTIEETISDFEVPGFMGLIAPSGIPRNLLLKINSDIVAATKLPDLSQQIAAIGLEDYDGPANLDPFNELLRREIAKWGKVVKAAGIKVE